MKKLLLPLAIILTFLAVSGLAFAFNTKVNPLSAYKLRVATSVPSNWWTDGLVGYWNFDGPNTTSTNGTRDTSGNNNWGTFNGGVKPTAGIVGQALSFDGVDDYVSLPNNAFSSLSTGTISAWIYPLTGGAEYPIFVIQRSNNDAIYYLLESIGSNIYSYYDTGPYSSLTIVAPITPNAWNYVVLRVDGTTTKLYVNGIEKASNSETGFFSSLTGTGNLLVKIGSYNWNNAPNPNNFYFNGLIDEERIYNRALGADEVMEHYLKTRRNLRI